LLIDSEAPVAAAHLQGESRTWLVWKHLAERPGDEWARPVIATELQCHLMVECMENWFLADRKTLESFFGQGFKVNQLPASGNAIESIGKAQVYQGLANATRDCKTKAQYGKGDHSFKLLELVDPACVTAASPWAKRFVEVLKAELGVG
jgi:hypothetical protein